uniref:Radical SAM superfamily enzyme YgiQ, UPF0313 family n=1 Tax=Candidatus Kentrum sp. UNK TaxID=2126344 RepID=A0A451AXN6_9GAMM|nr:MAG: Radical SAM superfamily enzyme YgiQ, UPF0313 family [Candidatus Kentron sp. UNK]VFK70805.1 MAG: Radical SAM superfamily enzyme YgiQ, UPF0313 family [Candidatus Kentron sp. UNK]
MFRPQRSTIGLIEGPTVALFDPTGKNWTPMYRRNPLLSKQVLMAQLAADGFDVRLVNLREGDYQESFGRVPWKEMLIDKVYLGNPIHSIDPRSCDAWGITANYMQEREVVSMVVRHVAGHGRPVVVGGSDAISQPDIYFAAGADAVVLDKTGAATCPVFRHLLRQPSTEPLAGVVFADGPRQAKRARPMSPEEWPLPSVEIAHRCLGAEYTGEAFIERLLGIGSVFPDIGCDRSCDFCQTPLYRVGYQRMTPARAIEWLVRQKEAGAGSTVMISDQFLTRVLTEQGRRDVLEIMQGARDIHMPIMWPNGLELAKATLGRGKVGRDMTPDDELIQALWGWDGENGTFLAYIPAERPTTRNTYTKVLPWQEHCEMMRRIVRAGVPVIIYGVIIGLPEDSQEDLLRLESAIRDLHDDLRSINAELDFQVAVYSISPIVGTPQWSYVNQAGLLRFDDPTLVGEFWIASCDTHHLSYQEISDWQLRLAEIGKGKSNLINYHGGLTGVNSGIIG